VFLKAGEIAALTRARVHAFLREPEAVFWVFVFPLVLALVLGWAFKDRGPEIEKVAIVAAPGSPLRERLANAQLLQVEQAASREAGEDALRHGRIAVLLIDGEPLVLRYDPQRPQAEVARLRIQEALTQADASPPGYRVEEVRDTGSRYIDWLFPGLLGMNLMGTGLWSIGYGIADMRQKRLLRRFLVTPMRKSSFLLSFILARAVFLVFEVTVLTLFAVLVLGVPLVGSIFGFALLCALGMLTFASIGLLVAARARTLEGVSGLMNATMVPMWLFCGVFFAYERYPDVAQPVIKVLPLTPLNDAFRALMLDGASLTSLGPELGILVCWSVFAFLAAIRLFRWE
jgi:ABC-type multidrug transport system permease subunit